MTQPYGSHGRPSEPHRPTPPGPYPPQGPPPAFGAPPPGPGGFPPGGYGPPPRKNNGLLPWVIVGAAMLVSGLGVLLVFLLTRGERGPDTQATPSSSSSSAPASSSSAGPSQESATGNLPGGARVAEPSDGGDGQFAGSGDVALDWVQAMADGDFQTAYDLSCPAVQDAAAAAAAANSRDPAWELGTYFFEQTLGGVGFTEGTFDGVSHAAASNQDMATFTLQLDNGETFTLLVYVGPDLTVCDFL